LTHALPVLASLDAPFTVYVATGFPDRTVIPWGVLLERHLSNTSSIRAEIDGREVHIPLTDDASRDGAFHSLIRAFERKHATGARALGTQLFDEATIRDSNVAITWSQLEQLVAHPLVTVGAHTVNHPILSALPQADVIYEMRESKRILEERLGRSVRHFAYPYGTAMQVTARELRLAALCGFASATTMRLSNVFSQHVEHPTAIPRIYGETSEDIELHMTGVVSALRYRGRRVVTV
jgi:peptidoglycan/xylan/chitin deacetylase (PgdA/CDA1 family)